MSLCHQLSLSVSLFLTNFPPLFLPRLFVPFSHHCQSREQRATTTSAAAVANAPLLRPRSNNKAAVGRSVGVLTPLPPSILSAPPPFGSAVTFQICSILNRPSHFVQLAAVAAAFSLISLLCVPVSSVYGVAWRCAFSLSNYLFSSIKFALFFLQNFSCPPLSLCSIFMFGLA